MATEENAGGLAAGRTASTKMSDQDSRARAAKRAAELHAHIGDMDQGTDEFYVDPRVIPAGWSYEWKRISVLGKEDPSYVTQIARNGWEPVPRSRHPEMMPKDWTGETIDRKGCMLMERPEVITQAVRDIERKKAREQVQQKEEQLAGAPQGTFDRNVATVNKGYDRMPKIQIPDK